MSSLFNQICKFGSLLDGLIANVKMTAPRDRGTTSQEQNTNRSCLGPQQPAQSDNGPKDDLLFVNDGESEHNSENDSETEGEWPCICGDGLNTEGTWIFCDKANCKLTWYHLACVGLEEAPAGEWICPQCLARIREIATAKQDPKMKGVAIKVSRKKDQGRWKGWRELPSEEEEDFKRKVESSWDTQILPGKTRTAARQNALYSENGSESSGKEKAPRQQLQMDRSKHFPGKKAHLDSLHHKDPELSPQSGSSIDGQTASKSERTVSPQDMTIDDKAASSVEDDSESKDWENVLDVDEIASGIVESPPESDLVSNDPTVRSCRLSTPEAASVLLSVASATTGECIDLEPTEGDQALVAALRGTRVGRYFA